MALSKEEIKARARAAREAERARVNSRVEKLKAKQAAKTKAAAEKSQAKVEAARVKGKANVVVTRENARARARMTKEETKARAAAAREAQKVKVNSRVEELKAKQAASTKAAAEKSRAKVEAERVKGKSNVVMTKENAKARAALQNERRLNPLGAAFGCALPSVAQDTIMRNLDYSSAQMTDVEKGYGQFIADIESSEAASRLTASDKLAASRRILYDHTVRMAESSKATILSADLGKSLESWASAKLGVVHRQFGLGQEYTDAGWARFSLQQAGRDGAGFMNKTLREQRLYEQVTDNNRRLKKIFKDNGIRDRAKQGYISSLAVEYGALPYLDNVGGLGRVSRIQNQAKAASFRRELLDMGIPVKQVDEIFEMGADVNRVYNQTGIIANQAGIRVGDATQSGIGYVPRIFSAEAQKRINWKHADLAEGTVEWIDGSGESVGSILTRTRQTFDTVVENEVILDFVIRTQSKRAYDNPLAIYEKVGGAGALLGDIIDDHRFMNTLLSSELGEDTIVALVDNGILGRVAMNSDEVRKFVTSKFNMPFKGLDELMATDWQKGYETYVRQLEGLARESNYVGQIVTNVTNGNWGVPGDLVRSDPDKYKGFVPLLGRKDTPGAMTQAQMDKFYLDKTTRMGVPVGRLVEDAYVHPIVAELMQSIHKASTDPITLGVAGNLIQTANRLWRGLALATVEFIPRQIAATTFMTFAGGGNLLSLPEVMARLTKYQVDLWTGGGNMRSAAEGAFDNTRRIYTDEKLTMLEMWYKAIDSGFINDIDPQMGMSRSGTAANTSSFHPADLRRNLRYAQNVLNEGGVGRLIGEMGGVASRAVQTMLTPVMIGNNLADIMGRFNGLLSTTKRYGDTDPWHNPLHVIEDGVYGAGHLVSGVQKYHGTYDEAYEHWRNYFYMYDDVTRANAALNEFVIPFWSFASKNIPATFRHVANHPSRYATFARIYAMMNSDAVQSQDLNEGNTSSWMLQAVPVFIKMKRQDGTDAWMAMPLRSIDPYTPVLNDAKGLTQEVLKQFGLWGDYTRPGTTGQILEDAPWSEDKSNYLQDAVLSKLYPSIRAGMSELSNTDLTTDFERPLDGTENRQNTFLGYAMTPRTEMWLRTFLPILATINNENPGNIFGKADYRNPRTGAVRQGFNSRMPGSGGVARTDRNPNANVDEFPDLALNNVLRFVGVKLYPVDEAANTGNTLIQMYTSLKEGKSWLQKGYRELGKMDEGSDAYNKQKTYLDNSVQFFYQIASDRMRLQEYARNNGMTPDSALTHLQSRGEKVGDLPTELSPQEEHDKVMAELKSED